MTRTASQTDILRRQERLLHGFVWAGQIVNYQIFQKYQIKESEAFIEGISMRGLFKIVRTGCTKPEYK